VTRGEISGYKDETRAGQVEPGHLGDYLAFSTSPWRDGESSVCSSAAFPSSAKSVILSLNL